MCRSIPPLLSGSVECGSGGKYSDPKMRVCKPRAFDARGAWRAEVVEGRSGLTQVEECEGISLL